MLRADLIDLINSGELWVFVGSGASADAGLPVWGDLAREIALTLDPAKGDLVASDPVVRAATRSYDWPVVFRRVEQIAGRQVLEHAVSSCLKRATTPGQIIYELADWPVSGFITSNYDDMIERALQMLGRQSWVPVGNTERELRKVSRDATGVVWHIHGMLGLGDSKSRLILTSDDYDRAYVDDKGLERQLGGLLTQRRVAFVGFGFSDPDLLRLLRVVGRSTDPTRPALALIGVEDQEEREAAAALLLEKYNVDPIFYRMHESDHSELRRILSLHGNFIARASLRYGQRVLVVPGHSIESTGLLLYNELALRDDFHIERDLFQTLLDSWTLAQLADGGKTATLLTRQLDAAEKLLGQARDQTDPRSQVDRTLDSLRDRGLITLAPNGSAVLSEAGHELVSERAARSELLHDRFVQSLGARCDSSGAPNPDASERVVAAATGFFLDAIEQRSLGLALTLKAWDASNQQSNAVQMLQTLPQYMERLQGLEEGIVLSRVVMGVLSDPSPVERRFLGAAMQAQFAMNLLGLDETTLLERVRQFRDTAFLLDSNIVIPYLAQGSTGYEVAVQLVEGLRSLDCVVATTSLLLDEVVEHANWAIDQSGGGRGVLGYREFALLTGRSDYRPNAFLEGHVASVADANGPPTLLKYLEACGCLSTGQTRVTKRDLGDVLESRDLMLLDIGSAFAGSEAVFAERDEVAEDIASRRLTKGTYRHERQVRAEAEVLLLVDGLRQHNVVLDDHPEILDAFFISTSRIIDKPGEAARPVTLTAASASQWLATLHPQSSDESAEALLATLLVELEGSGAELVNRRQLSVAFSPLIDESRQQLDSAIKRHQELIASAYASDARLAFTEIDAMDLPAVVNALVAQAESRIAEKAASAQKAAQQAKLTDAERQHYERLKADKGQRRRKYLRRQARLKSGKKRKKRRR